MPFEPISSCPVPCYLGKDTGSHHNTPSFQAVGENNKDVPEASFSPSKTPQLSQLQAGLVLQPLHQLCCPSLGSLQQRNALPAVRGSELDTGLKVWPHQCWAQGNNHALALLASWFLIYQMITVSLRRPDSECFLRFGTMFSLPIGLSTRYRKNMKSNEDMITCYFEENKYQILAKKIGTSESMLLCYKKIKAICHRC